MKWERVREHLSLCYCQHSQNTVYLWAMTVLVSIIIAIHIFVSIGLIFAILLHSGRGTGLSESFGGALPSSITGTSLIEKNLNRITVILATIFAFTSIALYLLYSGR